MLVLKVFLAWAEAEGSGLRSKGLSPTSYVSSALGYCLNQSCLALDECLGAAGRQGICAVICQSFSSLSLPLGVLMLLTSSVSRFRREGKFCCYFSLVLM